MSAVESLDILQRCLFFLVAAHGIAAKQKKKKHYKRDICKTVDRTP